MTKVQDPDPFVSVSLKLSHWNYLVPVVDRNVAAGVSAREVALICQDMTTQIQNQLQPKQKPKKDEPKKEIGPTDV